MIDLLPVRLREWVPLAWDEFPSKIWDSVVLTDNGELTEEAFEAGMNYLEALYEDDGYFDLGRTWLLEWVWQTAEQTEQAAFRNIRSDGQAGYVAARTMLTEVPYGTERALVEEYSRRGAAQIDMYRPVRAERCGRPWRTASSVRAVRPLWASLTSRRVISSARSFVRLETAIRARGDRS